jgi:hypothetical protein
MWNLRPLRGKPRPPLVSLDAVFPFLPLRGSPLPFGPTPSGLTPAIPRSPFYPPLGGTERKGCEESLGRSVSDSSQLRLASLHRGLPKVGLPGGGPTKAKGLTLAKAIPRSLYLLAKG